MADSQDFGDEEADKANDSPVDREPDADEAEDSPDDHQVYERLRQAWRMTRVILIMAETAALIKGNALIALSARVIVNVGDAVLPG